MPNQSKRLGVKTLDPNLLAYITQLAHKAGLAVTRAEKHYDTRITDANCPNLGRSSSCHWDRSSHQ